MILKIKNLLAVFFLTAVFLLNTTNLAKAEEESSEIISNEIKQLRDDLKTLEKAIYKKSDISQSTNSSSNKLNEDILTRHLLKLNEIESQFQDLTNKFEEINFKMDKLSKRITKMQSDNQLRFSDLESADSSKLTNQASVAKKKIDCGGLDIAKLLKDIK
tara:strand:- start:87 stop:566 length:480 start_codon:yes stop_codon:yes gene_type:complete